MEFLLLLTDRKGLADTALRTATQVISLVDLYVSQDVIVREDCETDEGIWVSEIKDGNEVIEN